MQTIKDKGRNGLGAKEQQNKMQQTLDKSKSSIASVESEFLKLTSSIQELNKNVNQLKNIEMLQIAHDYKTAADDKSFYEISEDSQKEYKSNHAHIVESTARNDAGLRAIAKRIVLLHGFLAGDSEKQTKLRLKIASGENTDALKKHRQIGMAQFGFMEDNKIVSVSGLTKQKNIKTGKNYTKEEAKELRAQWDKLTELKKQQAKESNAFHAVEKDVARVKMANIEMGMVRMTKAEHEEIKLFRATAKSRNATFSSIQAGEKVIRDRIRNKYKADELIEKQGTTTILDGNKMFGTTSRDSVLSKSNDELLISNNSILDVNRKILELLKGNKLEAKEVNREKKKLVRGAATRFGKKSRPKHIEDNGSGLLLGAIGGVSVAELTAKQAAKALFKKNSEKKIKDRIAKKAAAALAKKQAKQAATQKLVAKKAATTAAKVVVTKKAATAVAASAVSKKVVTKTAEKFSLSAIMTLARKVAGKMGWTWVIKQLAYKLPALGLAAVTGPLGLAVAIGLSLGMAYDIYQILLMLDSEGDKAITDESRPDLLHPSAEGESASRMKGGSITTKAVETGSKFGRSQRANQIAADRAAVSESPPVVANSGNTTNSGNTIVNHNYGSFDPSRLDTSDLSHRVPVEGLITPGI